MKPCDGPRGIFSRLDQETEFKEKATFFYVDCFVSISLVMTMIMMYLVLYVSLVLKLNHKNYSRQVDTFFIFFEQSSQ